MPRTTPKSTLPILVTVSLSIHLALLALPLSLPQVSEDTDSAALTLITITRPVIQRPAEPAVAEPVPEPAADPFEAVDPTPPEAIVEAEYESAPAATPEAGISVLQLRQQAAQTARTISAHRKPANDHQPAIYHRAPRLPGRPGWLHQHVGPVAPSTDRWKAADGSQHSRIVLASGAAVCFRTRAPTIQEVFNPWMSAALPMARGCGRERPESVDTTDPWHHAPPDSVITQ